MKFKYKAGFIAMVALIDLMVIVLVVLNNGKTNIKNDVSNKTAAHVLENKGKNKQEEKNEEVIEEEVIEESEENDDSTINLSVELEAEETVMPEEKNVSYDEMTIEEREEALYAGTLALEYSGLYTNYSERLSVSKGAIYFNGHKETYYDEKTLPGTGLNIPGRHVADDGTIRDEDGYICVAANSEYLAKGSILITSLGPAKVYDSGCASGIIDIYVNW